MKAALDELLGWPGISRSPQLSELLRYVVTKTLAGEESSIKAYAIAVDVFGRPQTFDPQSDPIVRVQARRLRTLLEQFYDSGKADSAVHIHLPLGRYVPEFQLLAATPEAGAAMPAEMAAMAPVEPERAGQPWSPRFLLNAVLGLSFTLIGVALAVALIRWTSPSPATTASTETPDFPGITIGEFDNLTGQTVLDDDVAAVAQRVSSGLGKFELLRVVQNGGRFLLRATVQESDGQFSLKAMLSHSGADAIIWSTTISPPKGTTDTEALTAASTGLTSILGAATGPLHAADRAWVSQQTKPPDNPGLYVCALEYMVWRDLRKPDAATVAKDCLKQALVKFPNDAMALAEDAGISAWLADFQGVVGVDKAKLLTDEAAEAGRAVSLMPESSFAYQQQGLVLARQGSFDAAMGALKKSCDLNPASMDALVVYGLVQWVSGDFTGGAAATERAIAGVPSPPAYYYMTRAFDALRQRRYYDAIDAAQALAAGDDELGPAIALAAAPVIGRNDLIDRYRPVILSNPHFQEGGIMTRIERLFKTPALTDRIREGLILAGIPPAALDAPFNEDGTIRKKS